MKVRAEFEDGALHIILSADTPAEQRMIGAVIEQPQDATSCAYMDKTLLSANVRYDGHWSNQTVREVRLSVYRPNREPK